jgi:hypothetical protein
MLFLSFSFFCLTVEACSILCDTRVSNVDIRVCAKSKGPSVLIEADTLPARNALQQVRSTVIMLEPLVWLKRVQSKLQSPEYFFQGCALLRVSMPY